MDQLDENEIKIGKRRERETVVNVTNECVELGYEGELHVVRVADVLASKDARAILLYANVAVTERMFTRMGELVESVNQLADMLGRLAQAQVNMKAANPHDLIKEAVAQVTRAMGSRS